MTHSFPQSGFIALISILIVSAVLLATTLGLAQFGIANRYFIMHLEQKAASKKLAEACAHIARVQVYNDPNYTLATALTVDIGSDTCTISSISESSGRSYIRTRATRGDSITNLCVTVRGSDGEFLSWRELPKSTAPCS